jgi:hypothetical protein
MDGGRGLGQVTTAAAIVAVLVALAVDVAGGVGTVRSDPAGRSG